MASDDESKRDSNAESSDGDAPSSGSDGESDAPSPLQTLVAGRARRATAGNRMGNLVELEEDDEIELLLGGDDEEDDGEFQSDEDAEEDAAMSSDDEDQGPNAPGDDDLEGERELQRREKAERAKKRKATDALTSAAGVKKKIRFDPAIPASQTTTAPKPPKKERESWHRRGIGGPSRTSMRKQTVANREITRARVKEHDALHAKAVARAKKKRHEREMNMPKEMTQADRLAEAAKVERKNAKSLNRWEALEKKRAEEQAAKLAALKDRKLEGPVVTYWSGLAKWLGPRLVKVGAKEVKQEPVVEAKKRGRKPKSYYEALEASKDVGAETPSASTPGDQATPVPPEAVANTETLVQSTLVQPDAAPTPIITFTPPQNPENFLNNIQESASLAPGGTTSEKGAGSSEPASASSIQVPPPSSNHACSMTPAPLQAPITNLLQPIPAPPPAPLVEETTSRNLVILTSFPNSAEREASTSVPSSSISTQRLAPYAFLQNNKKTARPASKTSKSGPDLCPITSLPARYRDPLTGVQYANAAAFKKLRELTRQGYVWSTMVGCFVGKVGACARGVPEGFLG